VTVCASVRQCVPECGKCVASVCQCDSVTPFYICNCKSMHAKHVSRNGSPIPPHAQVLLCLLCTVLLRYPTLSLSTRAPLSSTSSLVSGSWTTLAVRPTAELPVDRQCKWTQCESECECGCGCGCGCKNNVSARAAGKKAKDTNENVYHNLRQQERTHAHCASLSQSTIYN
jgi:hypothetical protein